MLNNPFSWAFDALSIFFQNSSFMGFLMPVFWLCSAVAIPVFLWRILDVRSYR